MLLVNWNLIHVSSLSNAIFLWFLIQKSMPILKRKFRTAVHIKIQVSYGLIIDALVKLHEINSNPLITIDSFVFIHFTSLYSRSLQKYCESNTMIWCLTRYRVQWRLRTYLVIAVQQVRKYEKKSAVTIYTYFKSLLIDKDPDKNLKN